MVDENDVPVPVMETTRSRVDAWVERLVRHPGVEEVLGLFGLVGIWWGVYAAMGWSLEYQRLLWNSGVPLIQRAGLLFWTLYDIVVFGTGLAAVVVAGIRYRGGELGVVWKRAIQVGAGWIVIWNALRVGSEVWMSSYYALSSIAMMSCLREVGWVLVIFLLSRIGQSSRVEVELVPTTGEIGYAPAWQIWPTWGLAMAVGGMFVGMAGHDYLMNSRRLIEYAPTVGTWIASIGPSVGWFMSGAGFVLLTGSGIKWRERWILFWGGMAGVVRVLDLLALAHRSAKASSDDLFRALGVVGLMHLIQQILLVVSLVGCLVLLARVDAARRERI